jgi:hypothetical protein
MAAFVLQSSLMARLSAVLVLLLFFVLTGCFRGSSKSTWSTASGADQYERLMWQAIRAKEWKEVDYHLAPLFVGVNANGQKFDRAGWVEYWKGIQVTDFSLGELTTQPDGPDMVVTYGLNLKGASSADMPAVRVLSVWQQVKNGWVLTAQSVTAVK